MRAAVAAMALVLLLAGCRDHTSAGTPVGRSAASASPLRDLVADPHATLTDVSVRPGPDGLTVRAWWVLTRHHHTRGAIVTSDDGMRSAAYVRGSYPAWAAQEPKPVKPAPAPGMGDLLPTDVFSLQDGTRAQQGGGDGATLDPFERLLRSVEGGPWKRFDVPETRGQTAYTSGQVVLADGRLLALLDAWSADRRGRANPVWHGLWISAGDDWASYRPWRPTFTPALPAAVEPWGPLTGIGAAVDPRQTRAGIVWVTTPDRVYVSTDGARTFHEIPARPR